VREAVCAAAPRGAGAAADRNVLALLGIDLDRLLDSSEGAPLDRPAGPDPVFPLGVNRARRRCAQISPPVGVDAQAIYEASLRLALARHERKHRSEHLAFTLLTLDPGVDWVLAHIGVDRRALLADLSATFRSSVESLLLRAERRVGCRSRCRDIIQRYQHVTGRAAIDGSALVGLIAG
jgi:hypothetical protein